MARDTTERAQFLAERRQGIGGSDVPAILGIDPWTTAQQVWESKMGMGIEQDYNLDMERGVEQEDWALRKFREMTGLGTRKIHRQLQGKAPWDHAVAHLDSHIIDPARMKSEDWKELVASYGVDPELISGPGVLEIKNPRAFKWQKVKRETGALPEYLAQVCHYFGVSEWRWGAFGIFHSDHGLIPIFFLRDDKLVADIMEKTRKWWETYVVGAVCPPEPELDIDLPEVTGILTRDDSPLWARLVEALKLASASEKEAHTQHEDTKQLVKDYMQKKEAQIIEGGGARIHYKPQKGRASFNKVALTAYGALDPIKVGEILFNMTPAEGTLEDLQAVLLDVASGKEPQLRGQEQPALQDAIRILANFPKLEGWLKESRLDLTQFETVGKASRPLKPYFFRSE